MNILPSVESSPSLVTTTGTVHGDKSTTSVSIYTPPPLEGAAPIAEGGGSRTDSPSMLSWFQNMRLSTNQSPFRESSPHYLESHFNLGDINNALQALDDDRDVRLGSLQPDTHLKTPHRSSRRRSSPRLGKECHRVEDEEPPSDAYRTVTFQSGLTKARELMSDLIDVLASSSIHLEPDSAMRSLHDRARKLRSFEPQAMRKVGFVGESGVGESD